MNTRALFVSCFLYLVTLSGCMAHGGGRSVLVETPDETYSEETSVDSRGQPTQVITHKVHPQTPGSYSGGLMGMDYYGGYSGDSHTDTPSNDVVRCVRMVTGQYAGQTFCPSAQGVVPLVRSSSEPGEVAQDPYKRQTINNAAAIQELQDCVNSGRTNCR